MDNRCSTAHSNGCQKTKNRLKLTPVQDQKTSPPNGLIWPQITGLKHPRIHKVCEAILLSSGLANEAYQRYAFEANQAGTYLAKFGAICRKYPDKKPESILDDLVASTPGDEGKWFAAVCNRS